MKITVKVVDQPLAFSSHTDSIWWRGFLFIDTLLYFASRFLIFFNSTRMPSQDVGFLWVWISRMDTRRIGVHHNYFAFPLAGNGSGYAWYVIMPSMF
jgi:hypothetical protein